MIGGSRDLPNRLWFSKSGDLFNFDLGEGLDDEAIEFSILSDQVNAIRGVFSLRHLQVFTSGAEWMITGDPLTPISVQIRRQTRTGSRIDRYVPPVNVDGATLYCARSGQGLYEFLYTDLEQAHTSTDLALLSRHVIGTPIEQDYDQKNRLLFVVREDGKFATLTVFRAEAVSAWTLHETDGAVTLSEPASAVQIGLPYKHIVEPLPPNEVGKIGAGRKIRLIEAIFRLQATAAMYAYAP